MELIIHGCKVLIDDDDYNLIKGINWWISVKKYTRYARNKKGMMHRVILGLMDKNILVDHKNGNGLDNRRANLRQCTIAENNRNVVKRISGTSKYRGVSWHKLEGKWQAQIKHNNSRRHLGYFINENDAAIAYNNAAKELHKEFASLNVIR
jgi:hypothetical protein